MVPGEGRHAAVRLGMGSVVRRGGCDAPLFSSHPGGLDAGLHDPLPADESGDPADSFTDSDSVWAYALSDTKGGYLCVVHRRHRPARAAIPSARTSTG